MARESNLLSKVRAETKALAAKYKKAYAEFRKTSGDSPANRDAASARMGLAFREWKENSLVLFEVEDMTIMNSALKKHAGYEKTIDLPLIRERVRSQIAKK